MQRARKLGWYEVVVLAGVVAWLETDMPHTYELSLPLLSQQLAKLASRVLL
jgi:hypothetical protein